MGKYRRGKRKGKRIWEGRKVEGNFGRKKLSQHILAINNLGYSLSLSLINIF
jgi:hypothetical protein